MLNLVRIKNNLIDFEEILILQRKPELIDGNRHDKEYYLLIFKNGREFTLSPEAGRDLLDGFDAWVKMQME